MLDETEIESGHLVDAIIIEDDNFATENGGHTVGDEGLSVGNEEFIDGNEGFIDGNEGFIDGNEGFIDGNEGFIDGNEDFTIEDEGLTYAFIESKRKQSFLPLLKEELRMKIQVRRLSEGKDELEIKIEDPPVYELTEEEKQKLSYRRAQNRKASERKRLKDRYYEERFRKTIDILSVENDILLKEKSKLLRTKAILERRLQRYRNCKCGKQTTYSAKLIKPTPVTKPERSDVTYHVLPSGSKYHTTCYTTNSGNATTTTTSLLPKPVQAMHFQHGDPSMTKSFSNHFHQFTDYNVIPVSQTKDSVKITNPISNDLIYNAPLIISSKLEPYGTEHENNGLNKNRIAVTNRRVSGMKNKEVYSQELKISDTFSNDTFTEKEQLLNDISEVLEKDKEMAPKLNIPNTVFEVL